MLSTVSDHVIQVCLMALVIFGSHVWTHRVQTERLRGEARRVRSVLTMSLRALRKLYEGNLDVLSGGKPPLISGRNQISLLRMQFSRLVCLDQPEIEAVWEASIGAESVEAAIAVAGKGVGAVAFGVPEDDGVRATLKSALAQACSMLETAEHLMTPTAMRRDERAPESAAVIEFAAHALRKKRRQKFQGAPVQLQASTNAF
jgi:hypothetical protein